MASPHSNRLLDMLKSATSPPPTTSLPPPAEQSPAPSSSTNNLAPPVASGRSPREPSPAPPPPSLQAVSLQDLFASMGTLPSPQEAPAHQGSRSPPGATEHQGNLMGMLKGTGQVPAAGGKERTISGPSTPGNGVVSPDPGAPNGADHKVNMLSMFKSPPAPSQEPVISHPISPRHDKTNAQPPSDTHDNFPPVPAPSQSSTGLKKSMFDFISPFDVFDKPAPKSAGPPKAEKKAPLPPPASTQPTQADQNSRQTSISSQPPRAVANDVDLPWLVGKVVGKGLQRHGPMALTGSINVDLSKPNLESLVNATGVTQVKPTSMTKNERVEYRRGRSVGVTDHYLAYALPKGRVRLIDKGSGSKMVLQCSGKAVTSEIIDLAVLSDRVALVGSDRSVAIFSVPASWKKDNPDSRLIARIAPTGTKGDAESIGEVFKVEWIEKKERDARGVESQTYLLAIGGTAGVVVVDPESLDKEVEMKDLVQERKVLKTEGTVAGFCLNQTHQAIGLLSSKAQFTLYSVNNLNRVWNRPLPLSAPISDSPSSVQFCDSNILVGQANDTVFDLVQIAVEVVSVFTIRLTAPAPCPPSLHFSQAVFDPVRAILWIAPIARGSVFGLRYNLKGKIGKAAELPVAFDMVAEYPLEPISSLVQGKTGEGEDAEFFFATPTGFSQGFIDQSGIAHLTGRSEAADDDTAASVATPMAPPATSNATLAKGGEGKKAKSVAPTPRMDRTPSKSSPVVVKQEVISDHEVGPGGTPRGEPGVGGMDGTVKDGMEGYQEELAKALKRTEDRLANNVKQTVQNQVGQVNARLDNLCTELGADITAKIGKDVKATLTTMIQQEFKKSVLPAINSSIQTEINSSLDVAVSKAMAGSLNKLTRDVEKGLTPVIHSAVQACVDRAVQDAVHSMLLPSMTAASSRLGEQLASEIKSEILQLRKDLTPPRQEAQASSEPLLRNLAASVADLQRRLSALTEQLSRSVPSGQPAPMPLPPHISAPPPHPPRPPQHPPAPPPLNPSQLEDAFLAALGAQTSPSTVALVNEYWGMTEGILPSTGGPILSQAIMLTLLHRLSFAMAETPLTDRIHTRLATWLSRVIDLIDPRDDDIAGYYPRVISVVQGILIQLVHNMGRFEAITTGGGEMAANAKVLKQVIEMIGGR